MNIIKRELRSNLKAVIIWAISIFFLLLAASSEFGVFKDNPDIADAMESFEIMFEMIGGSMANVSTPEGYLSLMSIYLYLPLAIYGALLGSSIISKEERDRTAEYLFTLPIKRNQV
ncbi:MAG: ABC transporter permease subunit, partial [Candidatus Izimaplasma sp.]|nr:ABC transporter permease subunit [Candidatus Izimaplasma bacterium]